MTRLRSWFSSRDSMTTLKLLMMMQRRTMVRREEALV